MDVRRRSSMKATIQHIKIPSLAAMGSPITGVIKPYQKTTNHPLHSYYTKASDALPLPLKLTNAVFFTLFFSTVHYLLTSWREKIRNSTPLHVITISEIAALVTFVSSFIYLLGFFGMGFVFFTPKSSHDDVWTNEEEEVNQALLKEDLGPCATAARVPSPKPKKIEIVGSIPIAEEDEEIIKSVVAGT